MTDIFRALSPLWSVIELSFPLLGAIFLVHLILALLLIPAKPSALVRTRYLGVICLGCRASFLLSIAVWASSLRGWPCSWSSSNSAL